MSGASVEATLELWASELRAAKARMRPLFTQERAAASAGGHCQVVEVMAALGRVARRRAGSGCHLDARLLAPDPEGLVAGATELSGGHQVPPRAEVAVDHGVG